MTILITGLDQPIGQYLLELCLQRAAKVRVVTAPGMPALPAHRTGFERVVGALTDDRTLDAAMRDVEVVYHTATIAQGTSQQLRQTNAGGTRRLLEACAGDVRRFVFVSTPGVYASHPTPDTWPVRADARREPHGPPQFQAYGQSMVEAEDYILEANRRYGMEYCLLRMATIWGRNRYPSGVVSALMSRPEMAEQMDRMLGPMQWLHGADAARAMLLSGDDAAARNETFLVAGAEAVTSFELLARLWDITRPNEANPFSAAAEAHRLPVPKLDIGKIAAALGFTPAITLRQCLEEVLGRIEVSTMPGATAPAQSGAPAVPSAATEPDMRGKTCVITGATSGIGLATAERLAAMGARLVLVGRNPARGEAALRQIRSRAPGVEATIHYADLERLDDVRRVAAEILAAAPRIDVLINNAGAMFDHRELTADGLERTFAVNHMSHFLLTALLRDRLVASAPARIVTIASSGHRDVTLDLNDLQGDRAFDPRTASKRAKLCNVLFTRELALQLAGTGVTANCLCPGFVATGMGDNLRGPFGQLMSRAKRAVAIPPAEGAQTSVYLASSPECAEVSGFYYENGQPATPSPAALDDNVARALWEISVSLAGLSSDRDVFAGSATSRTDAASIDRPMADKTCVITGATSGIGLATAEALAAMGARVVLVGRDPAKGEAALRRVRGAAPGVEASIHYADLLRLDEVRRVAREILDAESHIEVLINNAGAMFGHWQLTEDGLERTFALNHMAAFVMTALLSERLIASAPARIIMVSSPGHYPAVLDFNKLHDAAAFTPGGAYSVSKLCNVLFTRGLEYRFGGVGVTANCVEPGVVATGLGDDIGGPMGVWLENIKRSRGVSPEEGAQTVVYLAASAEVAGISGGYFRNYRLTEPSPTAQDDNAARMLWEMSAEVAEVE